MKNPADSKKERRRTAGSITQRPQAFFVKFSLSNAIMFTRIKKLRGNRKIKKQQQQFFSYICFSNHTIFSKTQTHETLPLRHFSMTIGKNLAICACCP
jgi:hypothetical protein